MFVKFVEKVPVESSKKTIILSLDESHMVAAVFRWTLELLQTDDYLLILSCANPTIPPGRSPDNFGIFSGLYSLP